MAEETHTSRRRRFGLRDVSGTTIAVSGLAILGAAALVTAPLWLWYRRKRKRTDVLAGRAAEAGATSEEPAKDGSDDAS